jgi:hypothetical protein
LHYATALTILEDSRINNNSLALAATGNKNQLFNRIKRIMEMKKESSAHSRYSFLVVAVVTTLFIASVMTFTPSLAQKADTGKQTQQKKTTTSKTVTTDPNGKKKVVVKTRSDGKTTDDEDNNSGNIQIKIVTDEDGDVTTANVMLIDDDQDFIDSKSDKRKKVIVAKGGNGSANTIVINKAELNRELDEARKELEDVNWDEIGAEIAQALASVEKELHMEEMGKEVRIEIKKELEKSKAALKDAKRDIEKSKKEIAQSRKEIAYAHAVTDGKGRASAKAGDAEVTTDSDKIEDMLDKMEHDGLINREKKFTIEKEQNELYVNGNKQPTKVYDKYSRYMKGNQVTIKGSKGSLNINVSN